jgi:hypothetical protein
MAAIAEWFQGLFSAGDPIPVLVGGAAVELYTRGGYATGDLDFVGDIPPAVARLLEAEGFRKEGRHWIHDEGRIYLEFPSSTLEPEAEVARVRFGRHEVLVVSPEDILVDRLASWQFWKSSSDAAGAYLVWRSQADRMDVARIERLADKMGVAKAYRSLKEFASRWEKREPSGEDLASWARS